VAVVAHPQSPHQALPKGDPILGERIKKGIAFDGRLWLCGTMADSKDSSGGLVSLSLRDQSRTVHFRSGVLDIESSDHDLWVLRQLPKENAYVVSVWKNGVFDDLASFNSEGKDQPIALLNSNGVPAVLSAKTIRALELDIRSWHAIALQGNLRSGVQVTAATPVSGGSVYVGINIGEWGGGLQQVDLKTGAVTNVERRDTRELCAGPLNSECDPVTGLIADPQRKECILASVGLVHMGFSEGRILRVCDSRVYLVAEVVMRTPGLPRLKQTEAFYGLVRAADGGFWGITWRALYRFGANGEKEKEYKLPELEAVSGLYLSRKIPGAIVLRTDVNWAVSTSGYTPLVVPVDEYRP
jgi:hypothetical protein